MTARSEAEATVTALQPAVDAYERSKRPGVRLAAPGPLEVLASSDNEPQTTLDVDPQMDLGL